MEQLKNVLDPITADGIFTIIHTLHPDITWLTDENVKHLDIEYYLGHSGEKFTSRVYDMLREKETSGSITSALQEMAGIILQFCLDNWNNVYKAYTTDYKPLENYSMIEQENVNSKVKTSVSTASDVYGFNSDSSVPSSKVENESTTEGSKDDNERVLTRSGNIGVTTSQMMLQSELDLRKFKFFVQVMNDIDKYMCLQIY